MVQEHVDDMKLETDRGNFNGLKCHHRRPGLSTENNQELQWCKYGLGGVWDYLWGHQEAV